jgi:hypothetical protein
VTPAAEPEPAPQPEQPKRRSTVREPVFFQRDEESASPAPSYERQESIPEPVEEKGGTPDQGQIAPERPRRLGWWSRR